MDSQAQVGRVRTLEFSPRGEIVEPPNYRCVYRERGNAKRSMRLQQCKHSTEHQIQKQGNKKTQAGVYRKI